jgi:hypothetical protein
MNICALRCKKVAVLEIEKPVAGMQQGCNHNATLPGVWHGIMVPSQNFPL